MIRLSVLDTEMGRSRSTLGPWSGSWSSGVSLGKKKRREWLKALFADLPLAMWSTRWRMSGARTSLSRRYTR